MDETDKVVAQYAEWESAWDRARERAAVLLEGEPTDAELVAAVYAGWLECFRSSTTRPVDWLAPVAHMVEAVAYAIDHPDGTTERARETVAADIAAEVAHGHA